MAKDDHIRIPALRVKQWLREWDNIRFDPAPTRSKPAPRFFVFSMSAYELKRLTGIYRRDPNKPPAEDIGIQRRHIKEKSNEILRYIQDGFPLSKINKKRLVDQSEVDSLRMPGWLSTAVVINILGPDDPRGPKQSTVPTEDLVTIDHADDETRLPEVVIPSRCLEDQWEPKIHPMEVIDGQHRLWALEKPETDQLELWTGDFQDAVRQIEIPVVAFWQLDRTWQAYLFYTINQLPKKVDPSLAYDLYPLLRHQDWLDRFEGPEVYRQTRAQDLAILLWSCPASPWKNRIARVGREKGKVSQSAFVRSLVVSFIKRFSPAGKGAIGGLFGPLPREHDPVLQWSREQQAAFLIMIWDAVDQAVSNTKSAWAEFLRERANDDLSNEKKRRWPFISPLSLLTTDQGVRCVLQVFNDLFWLWHEDNPDLLNGFEWTRESDINDDDGKAVEDAVKALVEQCRDAKSLSDDIARCLASFDWRTSKALRRDDDTAAYDRQATYRGSSGYRAMRQNALAHLSQCESTAVSTLAKNASIKLGYREAGE